jgi:LmbE family N-acetylglucosaminyl deacetylase
MTVKHMFRVVRVALAIALSASAGQAQSWRDAAAHLGTTARVLVVGTRPDDEDNALIAWLSLGRHVETAFLSLTRGEAGVNVAGLERDAPLAVVRTAELLAERQRDGAHQYFTRAYDIGSTEMDSTVDAAWPHDSLLRDVVAVVRAFRPHVVIVLAAEGGERDATRRLAARLTAEAFSVAGDTMRLPATATWRLPAWTTSRLFTRIDSAPSSATQVVAVDVGEFDRRVGRSYAEIGADIRRLQRSQATSPTPPVGRVHRFLRLDSSRVGGDALFGAGDTTLSRFGGTVPPEAQAHLDTLRSELDRVHVMAFSAPADSLAARLARVARRTSDVRLALPCTDVSGVPACPGVMGDLAVVLNTIRERATRTMLAAAGIVIDGTVDRELVAAGDSVPVAITVYNGGGAPVTIGRVAASAGNVLATLLRDTSVVVLADSAVRWSANLHVLARTHPWWQINGLVSGKAIHELRPTQRSQLIGGEDRVVSSAAEATVSLGGVDVSVVAGPLAYRSRTSLRGDVRHPLAGVPETSVLLERTAEYERAGLPIDRVFRVYLWSARSTPDTLAVTLRLPSGLTADSVTRTVALPPYGARDVFFRLRGMLRPGADTIAAIARSVASVAQGRPTTIVRVDPGAGFNLGVVTHEYPHIPSQQFVRFSNDRLEAVDVRIPPRLRVASVGGTADVRAALAQLQVNLQTIDPGLLSVVDLSRFTTVLIGGDVVAGGAFAGAVPALRGFLRNGGTVLVLQSGEEIARSGLLPYPVSFGNVPSHVSDPAASVRVTDVRSALLTWPNRITATDFERWTGERARNAPVTFDPRYRTPFSVAGAGKPPTLATLLAATVGKGTIIYTTLTLDRQLADANPGAARLMINLLAAGLYPGRAQ